MRGAVVAQVVVRAQADVAELVRKGERQLSETAGEDAQRVTAPTYPFPLSSLPPNGRGDGSGGDW